MLKAELLEIIANGENSGIDASGKSLLDGGLIERFMGAITPFMLRTGISV